MLGSALAQPKKRANKVEIAPRADDADRNYLFEREKQAIALVVQGLTNKAIAKEMSLTEGTIKIYLSRAFKVLKVKSRFEIIAKHYQKNE